MGAGIKESGHFRQRVGEATINLVKHATLVYFHYYTLKFIVSRYICCSFSEKPALLSKMHGFAFFRFFAGF
jgi:hypothetical protein